METKQVVCMKWGTLYGAEYVNTLYAMVKRHISGPFRFVCLTDDRNGIIPQVECHDCPIVDIPEPYRMRGWRKVSLFAESDKLFGLTGHWLYLDLDVVITGSLDEFFSYSPDKSFVVMQNWTQPGQKIGNTSVYRFQVGADTYLLENLVRRQTETFSKYRNSQTYLSKNAREVVFWPDEWCVLFKSHCVPGWPRRLWKVPVLPETARVVAFPGVPNPHQALRGEWPAKGWKKIYKFIRPTPWIGEHWK